MNMMFRWADGRTETHAGTAGQSVMQLTTPKNLDAIVAQCGGGSSCATLHWYILASPEALKRPGSTMKDILLDGVMAQRRPNNRLSCQMRLDAGTADLIVKLPDSE